LQALLASLPIAAILLLMIVWRQSAARAGVAGVALTLVIAITAFGYGTRTHVELGPVAATAGAATEAVFLAATIIWIIFPALCIFEMQRESGAFELLRRRLGRVSDDPRLIAILVAWFFGLFMEGAAGFGTPVALGAPILVSLGFSPVNAVALMLIGHAAGVSFGAVGTPILPQIAATGLDPLQLSGATGLLHALIGWVLLYFVHRLALQATDRKQAAGDWRDWLWTGYAAVCFLVPFLLIARYVGPELPTIGAALIGAGVFVLTLRMLHRPQAQGVDVNMPASGSAAVGASVGRGASDPAAATGTAPAPRSLLRSATPYLVLVLLTAATRLWPDARQALEGLAWEWSLTGGFQGRFAPLYHPGTLLAMAFLLGGLLQGVGPAVLAAAASRAALRLLPVIVALVSMLALSRLMVHAGMIEALAELAAGSAGPVWPMLAPAVGALGTFVTGSATASNILFTDFQAATAEALGLSILPLIAAQGFGAAVGNVICPHNIVAGGATVGISGREGDVLRLTLPACLVYTALGGILVFVLLRLGAGNG
jgi:lactate permease